MGTTFIDFEDASFLNILREFQKKSAGGTGSMSSSQLLELSLSFNQSLSGFFREPDAEESKEAE